MKARFGRMLLHALAATALLLLGAQLGFAQIAGTKHDLSQRFTGTTDQICIFCHTPHIATTGLAAPLWNHALTTQTFQTYSSTVSPTFNSTTEQPGGVSKLCLSCHDGTVALDAFGGRTGTTTIGSIRANLGTDLRTTHPISFTYDTALVTADGGGLVTPASASQVVADIPLFNAKVECASCHNVHNNTNAPFLRASNAQSGLCLKCHIK